MRVTLNISIRPYESRKESGTKAELKNLLLQFLRKGLALRKNARLKESYVAAVKSIRETVVMTKSNWRNSLMRVKEGSADYRCFPEPDLPMLRLKITWIEQVRLASLSKERRAKYVGRITVCLTMMPSS